MRIRNGFEITYDCPAPTPMMLMVSIHPERQDDLETPDWVRTDPPVDVQKYIDGFGNVCSRIVAPAGRLVISADAIIRDAGRLDAVTPDAVQHPVQELPEAALVYLLGSRYCETDRLSNLAWTLFGHTPPGWGRVQAICDFVHDHIAFNYQNARATRGAFDAYQDRTGVCRDFAHLAVAFCRCMNIPARYCTGYMGDFGVPLTPVMDFSAWFEAYLGGAWHTFDARNNFPRTGRVLMARGRDATDVAIANTFGPAYLTGFRVFSDDVTEDV